MFRALRLLAAVLLAALSLAAVIDRAGAAQRSSPAWWDPDGVGTGSDWHYRVPVSLAATSTVNSTAKVDVDFAALMSQLGISGTLDTNSIRVVRPGGTLATTQEYNEAREVLPGVKLTFTDAGHILGSACVHLDIEVDGAVRRLTFSGDVGRYVDRLLPDPATFRQADIILCESTYGDRDHPPIHEVRDELLEHVRRVCLERKGKLIIPAFSIGKTQELLHTLNGIYNEGRLPRVPVYVDSPLSVNATAIYRKFSALLQDDVRAELERDPDLFVLDVRGVPWDGSAGMTLSAPWDGAF